MSKTSKRQHHVRALVEVSRARRFAFWAAKELDAAQAAYWRSVQKSALVRAREIRLGAY